MVITTIVKVLQEKLVEKGIDVSMGKIVSLRPFFITYPTNKEIALCLCKMCLNARMMYEVLVKQAEEDGDEVDPTSLTNFFISSCTCPKSPNGYYRWKCVDGTCSSCKKSSPQPLKCSDSTEVVKVSQFELTKKMYEKVNKEGKVEKKVSSQTEKVEKLKTLKELHKKVLSLKNSYTKHTSIRYIMMFSTGREF